MRSRLRQYGPGFAVLVAVGLVGRWLADLVPHLNYILMATLLGLVVANSVGLPGWAKPGVSTYKLWLEAGIVLMGGQLVLGQVLDSGLLVLLMVVGTLLFSLIYVETIATRLFGLHRKLGSLLAVGSSICGVSAIVVTSGIIDPDEDQIAYAVATVLLFDVLTLFTYPTIGRMLALPDTVFGVWAGISMFSTGPVAAAGYEYSEAAGQWAVLTKLTRNTFLGLVATGYALRYANRDAAAPRTEWRQLWRTFPKFVIGFALFVAVASLGLFSSGQVTALEHASNWLFLLAFVGLGLNIDLAELRNTGATPVLVVLVTLVTVSSLTLGVALLLF